MLHSDSGSELEANDVFGGGDSRSCQLHGDVRLGGDTGGGGSAGNNGGCGGTGSNECPEINRALDGVRYIAECTMREEESVKVKEDWKYIAMVLDRWGHQRSIFYCFMGYGVDPLRKKLSTPTH